jgi:phenylacetic acid degradation operon negative regulatory protein
LTGFYGFSNVRGVRRITAKSFVVDQLSVLAGRPMPVRALVAAASLFHIEENSLRVALARLVAGGTVERDERGAYRLGERARPVQQQVASWRRLEERVRPWRGGWIGVATNGLPRVARRRAARAFRFFGFRELTPGLHVRPDNLTRPFAEIRGELLSLGLPDRAAVLVIAELDPLSDARARSLWDTPKLVAEYRRSLADLEASAARLTVISPKEAMVETFTLGGRVIRQLALDPLLPDPIVDGAQRRALVAAMRRYDRLGHAAWRAFFADYRLTSVRAPVDSTDEAGVRAA